MESLQNNKKHLQVPSLEASFELDLVFFVYHNIQTKATRYFEHDGIHVLNIYLLKLE
jgi:hypothetical protein